MILNPKKEKYAHLDQRSREIMLKTIDFFENMGLAKVKKDYHERVWYAEFLEFIKENRIFATLLTPSQYSQDPDTRWIFHIRDHPAGNFFRFFIFFLSKVRFSRARFFS